jgi:hypothetical protein
MDTATAQTERGKQFMRNTARENWMDTSHKDVLEILEQNAKWWEHAAATCERTATCFPAGTKEEWQLMGAVYRERAEMVAQFINQLRQKGVGA